MRNTFFYKILLVLLVFCTACENWLDVQPKSRVESSELFEDESGFEDALWGIYTLMTGTSLYGRELTFGMVDVIGQVYSSTGSTTSTYTYLKNYQYDESAAESMIDNAWSGLYNVISNVNNLIANLRVADQNMFSENHYNIYLGEALALRAYLHFDLLRLFAPSYAANPNATAIPYVTEYSYNITPSSSVTEVLDYILEDLNEAADLLRQSDPIYTGIEVEDEEDVFLTHRNFHMNYYAVIAELARVYLYKEDATNALLCAQEVIDSEVFTWTPQADIAQTNEAERDRIFSPEHIFALQVENMADNIENYLTETTAVSSQLLISETYLNNRFPVATHSDDYRRLYTFSGYVAGATNSRFCTKLWQVEDMNTDYAERMPLIRLPEMYLIAAEANLTSADTYLDELRANRGISASVADYSVDEIMDEIQWEYLREFTNEGIVFYYYKRLNASQMDGLVGTFNTDMYVLPMPQEELEFGNRD